MARLALVQAELPTVKKDMNNPFFKSKYADINSFIEAIRPVCAKYGVVVLQPLTHIEGRPAVKTILSCETGEVIESVMPIDDNKDPQKVGGLITYVRRYALQSMFCMQASDDDAESVVRPTHNSGGGGARQWNKGK
jgi:hypothetical protein